MVLLKTLKRIVDSRANMGGTMQFEPDLVLVCKFYFCSYVQSVIRAFESGDIAMQAACLETLVV